VRCLKDQGGQIIMAGKDTKKTVGTGIISEMDRYLFGEGTHYEIYNKLGAHPVTYRKKKGMYFGYTEENKLVNFTGKNIKEGSIISVKISSAKTWSLDGEAYE